MKNVFFCPGFAGSYLCTDTAGQEIVWVSVSELLLGKTRQLELAANGVDPEPPDGRALFPSEPYPDYYSTALAMLGNDLLPSGYVIFPYPYDWRLKLRDQGRVLANRIRSNSSSAEPATIVGHSMGGLLARCAWADLVSSGEQALVRRIISLGSPHGGSYGIVGLLSGFDDSALGVALLDLLGNALAAGSLLYFGTLPLGPLGVARITQTWPGAFELLPSLPAPPATPDPLREALYDAQNWLFLARPKQKWLDYARDDWQPFLASPATMPPTSVMTSVVSTGIPTPATLLIGQLFGQRSSFGVTDDGDGVVTEASATLPGSRVFPTNAMHFDLTRQLTLSGDLVTLILEEAPPPPPPAPPLPPVWISPPLYAAPPTPGGISGNADC